MEIQVYSRDSLAAGLQRSLESEFAKTPEIVLTIRKPALQFRSVEPAILVAGVTAVGTAIGTVIGGLLRIAQENRSQKIVIQGSKGQKIEVPANTSAQKIDLLIERVKQLESDTLKVSLE
jgi:hypothetical protein